MTGPGTGSGIGPGTGSGTGSGTGQLGYVGLGSNLGDRLGSLRLAVTQLAAIPGVTLARRSEVWETRPLGPGTGPFLNAAVELLWSQGQPEDLLEQLLEIEGRHGRERRQRWGDRTIDLDLLCAYTQDRAELVADLPGLTLPHPGLHLRDFVLQPLVDIDPSLPVRGQPCAALLAALPAEERTILRRFASLAGK